METQGELFPDIARKSRELAVAEAKKATSDALSVLLENLPEKATCTVPEASEFLGVSVRSVELLISDGTLLAAYANRSDAAIKQHARPIVRSARPFDRTRSKFLTLEELRMKRSNVGV